MREICSDSFLFVRKGGLFRSCQPVPGKAEAGGRQTGLRADHAGTNSRRQNKKTSDPAICTVSPQISLSVPIGVPIDPMILDPMGPDHS